MPIYSEDQSSTLHNVGPDYDYIDNGREPENSSTKKDCSELSLLPNANPTYISRKGENVLHCNSEEIHFQPPMKGETNPSYISIKKGSENKGEEDCFQLSTQHIMNHADGEENDRHDYDYIENYRGGFFSNNQEYANQ